MHFGQQLVRGGLGEGGGVNSVFFIQMAIGGGHGLFMCNPCVHNNQCLHSYVLHVLAPRLSNTLSSPLLFIRPTTALPSRT